LLATVSFTKHRFHVVTIGLYLCDPQFRRQQEMVLRKLQLQHLAGEDGEGEDGGRRAGGDGEEGASGYQSQLSPRDGSDDTQQSRSTPLSQRSLYSQGRAAARQGQPLGASADRGTAAAAVRLSGASACDLFGTHPEGGGDSNHAFEEGEAEQAPEYATAHVATDSLLDAVAAAATAGVCGVAAAPAGMLTAAAAAGSRESTAAVVQHAPRDGTGPDDVSGGDGGAGEEDLLGGDLPDDGFGAETGLLLGAFTAATGPAASVSLPSANLSVGTPQERAGTTRDTPPPSLPASSAASASAGTGLSRFAFSGQQQQQHPGSKPSVGPRRRRKSFEE